MNENRNAARAHFLRRAALLAGAALVAPDGWAQKAAAPAAPLDRRAIPSSGQQLPVIGCGTWIGFDVADGSAEFEALREVVRVLHDAGGTVLDSSPMYGRSEAVAGKLIVEASLTSADRFFVATKVWTSGRDAGLRQMRQSLELLGRVDLMQVHNLLDWRTHLPTLYAWKKEGRIAYVGVSHYTASAYRELEAVLRAEPLDFVQVNYAIDDREAEERILPLARERGIAVLVNRPFGGGGLLRRLAGRPLPDWAAGIGATSWAQLLLKYILAHPAVTCAIPGTGNPRHMAENLAAGTGEIPDQTFWRTRIDAVLA